MHSSLSSAKTLLHMLARISFYNFPSFKEKAPHSGDSGQSSTFSHSAGSHSSCFHICWLPGTLSSCHGGTSLHKPCQNFLRNFLREKDHMESWIMCVCVCVLVTQLCLILWAPMDCSPPGSSVHGSLQARILEWAAIPFSSGSSRPKDWTWVSCIAGRFFTVSALPTSHMAQWS